MNDLQTLKVTVSFAIVRDNQYALNLNDRNDMNQFVMIF